MFPCDKNVQRVLRPLALPQSRDVSYEPSEKDEAHLVI